MTSSDDLGLAIEPYHAALPEFARGNPEPAKGVFSHRDDVTVANPFGPPVRGWKQVSERLEFASSRFRDGDVTGVDRVGEHVASYLACIHEIKRWRAKVGGRDHLSSFDLRVTSIFRREDDAWKLVHRHADPLTTSDADGPLRGSGE